MIKNCPLKKSISKLLFQKISQYCSLKKMHFKKHSKNCSIKKCISKSHVKLPLKIAPPKNAFQNCYKLSIGNKNKNLVGLKYVDYELY